MEGAQGFDDLEGHAFHWQAITAAGVEAIEVAELIRRAGKQVRRLTIRSRDDEQGAGLWSHVLDDALGR
jgi:hypothetical protein